jgi:hypothetical protein
METTNMTLTGETVIGGIKETSFLLMKDFDATPDVMLTSKVNDCGRSAIEVTRELAVFNTMILKVLNGEPVNMMEDMNMEAAAAAQPDRDSVRAGYEASINALVEKCAAFTDEDWAGKVMAPWGAEVTRAHMASWVSYHCMYHCGQVNFIQVMHGDNEVHWM